MHVAMKNIKRLRLGKTTGWATQIFGLDYFIPHMAWYLWVHEKFPNFFFFFFETGLPEWIFQIWSKNFKSDQVFVYTKKSLF